MANYNFKLAKQIINSCDNLQEASLGMHEDWAWTAETVWEDGEYTRELPDDSEEINEEYVKSRKEGLSLMAAAEKYGQILIAGIYGSYWATPVLELEFKDGSTKTFNCYTGMTGDEVTKIENKMLWASGCLSRPIQESRDSIEIQDINNLK